MSQPQIWFITGASSGLGRSLLEHVLQNGDTAVATLRQPEAISSIVSKYPKERLLVLKLDVSNESEVTSAFSAAEERFDHVDVVFNNAGFYALGEVEGTPDEVARAMFDVNFWGAAYVSRAAVKFFREVNQPGRGGILLQSSSLNAIEAIAAMGYYAASKYALEGLSEALSKEVSPSWNIQITSIEFGGFRTSVINNSVVLPGHTAYSDPSLASSQVRRFAETVEMAGDSEKAVSVLYKLVSAGQLPQRLQLGKDAVVAARNRVLKSTHETDEFEKYSDDLLH